MHLTSSQHGKRSLAVLLALLLAWLPLSGMALPAAVSTGDSLPEISKGPAETMPCHAPQHAQTQPQTAQAVADNACPSCMVEQGCDCCDHAMPASLPKALAAIAPIHYQAVPRHAEQLPRAPQPPPQQQLRPPRT